MQNFVSVSSSLGGCGSKKLEIPSKYIRYSFNNSGTFLSFLPSIITYSEERQSDEGIQEAPVMPLL